MASLAAALTQIRDIEVAVAAGDLESANTAAQCLKPLLVSDRIEDILALRKRVENLQLSVKALRNQDAVKFKKLKQQRGGAAAYQKMQKSMRV